MKMNSISFLLFLVIVIICSGCTEKEETQLVAREDCGIAVHAAQSDLLCYSGNALPEEPLESAQAAQDHWRVIGNRNGFNAYFTTDSLALGEKMTLPDIEITSKGESFVLRNATLERGQDDYFDQECYYLRSDVSGGNFGIGIASMDDQRLSGDNLFVAVWQGKGKCFEGETAPSMGEKIVIRMTASV